MEKLTDHLLQTEFNSVFNTNYNTKHNPKLFNTKIPDGWKFLDINNKKYLFIIENKSNIKLLNQGKKQLFNYFNNLPFDKLKKTHKIILILGYGSNIDFNYILFKYNMKNNDKNPIETNYKLNHYNKQIKLNFDIKQIHELNQYLYDNGINLPKSQKTLFIASILICLKINNKFIDDFDKETNGYSIADKIINSINEYYKDYAFTQSFNFIKNTIHNNKLFELFIKLEKLIDIYGIDILNLFYSEFCIYDRNNDGKFGIILTPDDIVELMVSELNILNFDTVCDFCTGTGSFLIKASKYSKHLIGCENNDERYSLAKCNFILNDLDYTHLYYNSCFNQEFDKYDKVIINPPFSCPNPDSLIELNETNWKNFKREQKFILYQVQLLKENGIGCCIIPSSNINNGNNSVNKFKQELLKYVQILKIINCNDKVFIPNATVKCAIVVFKKCQKESLNVKIIDYTSDGYKINKNIRIKKTNPNIKESVKDLLYNNNWNYFNEVVDHDIIQILLNYYNQQQYFFAKEFINNKEYDKLKLLNTHYDNILKFNYNSFHRLKLSDFLEIIKCKTFSINNTNCGKYPLYGASQYDFPVKHINSFSINTNTYDDKLINKYGVLCVNKTGNGGAGLCFIRKGIFAINSTVMLCKILIPLNEYNVIYIGWQLHNIFDRNNGLNLIKFNETSVDILNID